MTTIRSFIERYPVLTYFALVFAISWGGIFVVVGVAGGFPGTEEQTETLMLPVLLALFAGPSIAGLVLTGLVHGRTGYRDLLTRMTRWQVDTRWYAVALLTAPLLFAGVSFALSLFFPEYLPGIVTTGDKAALLLFGIGWGLLGGGLLEELGWTGFAVPPLKLHHGIFGTGLIVGLLWGAWHFLPIFWMSDPSGAVPLAVLLPVQLFAWLPAYRVLMVWVYDRTESLLVAMLMHASLSASMLILQPAAMAGVSLLTYVLVLGAALWVVVAGVAVAHGGHLSRLLPRQPPGSPPRLRRPPSAPASLHTRPLPSPGPAHER
jgi:uncharacterized protein